MSEDPRVYQGASSTVRFVNVSDSGRELAIGSSPKLRVPGSSAAFSTCKENCGRMHEIDVGSVRNRSNLGLASSKPTMRWGRHTRRQRWTTPILQLIVAEIGKVAPGWRLSRMAIRQRGPRPGRRVRAGVPLDLKVVKHGLVPPMRGRPHRLSWTSCRPFSPDARQQEGS
jgi:hypothetical protein